MDLEESQCFQWHAPFKVALIPAIDHEIPVSLQSLRLKRIFLRLDEIFTLCLRKMSFQHLGAPFIFLALDARFDGRTRPFGYSSRSDCSLIQEKCWAALCNWRLAYALSS